MAGEKFCSGLHWMDRAEALEWLKLKAPELLANPPSIFVPVHVTEWSHILIDVTPGALLNAIVTEVNLPGISYDFASQHMWFVSFEGRAEHDERVRRLERRKRGMAFGKEHAHAAACTCPGCCGEELPAEAAAPTTTVS